MKNRRNFIDGGIGAFTILILAIQAAISFAFQKLFEIVWTRWSLDKYLDRFKKRKNSDSEESKF